MAIVPEPSFRADSGGRAWPVQSFVYSLPDPDYYPTASGARGSTSYRATVPLNTLPRASIDGVDAGGSLRAPTRAIGEPPLGGRARHGSRPP